jgi:hypothetical protein
VIDKVWVGSEEEDSDGEVDASTEIEYQNDTYRNGSCDEPDSSCFRVSGGDWAWWLSSSAVFEQILC